MRGRFRVPENFSVARARVAQRKIAAKVLEEDAIKWPLRYVAGVDVAYRGNVAFAAAVVVETGSLKLVDSAVVRKEVSFPYIPTLLAFREVYPAWAALKALSVGYELLLVDGNGRLHPFKAGFACHLGVIVDKPTIGVAKKLLCGRVGSWRGNTAPVYVNGEILGLAVLTRRGSKPIYVSIGHKVSLRTAARLVISLVKRGAKLPEPLRLAHKLATAEARRFGDVA